jgi:neprilysin
MKISELQATYSFINWKNYLNSIMPANTQFNDDDIIINAVPDFFSKLNDTISATSKETIANYLMWRVALSSVSYLPKAFRDRQQEYSRILTGSEAADPRGLQCTRIALSYFSHALGSLYVQKHFKEEAKAKMNEMVDNIMAAFKGMLDEIDWMDDVTKRNAHEKASSMRSQMAYADELLDESKLSEYYLNFPVTVDENAYHETVLSLGKASTAYSLSRLRQPIDKLEWPAFVTPAIVNAFYSSNENTIKFPAGILQGAFFNVDRPHYMNYGGIGFVIGHGEATPQFIKLFLI